MIFILAVGLIRLHKTDSKRKLRSNFPRFIIRHVTTLCGNEIKIFLDILFNNSTQGKEFVARYEKTTEPSIEKVCLGVYL